MGCIEISDNYLLSANSYSFPHIRLACGEPPSACYGVIATGNPWILIRCAEHHPKEKPLAAAEDFEHSSNDAPQSMPSPSGEGGPKGRVWGKTPIIFPICSNRSNVPTSVKNRFRSADFCQLLPEEKPLSAVEGFPVPANTKGTKSTRPSHEGRVPFSIRKNQIRNSVEN